MKFAGKKISGPNMEIVAIPRTDADGNNCDLIFHAQAILSMEEFQTLCPEPEPPMIQYANGELKADIEDANYIEKITTFNTQRLAYLFIKTYSETPGLEWETVKITDPATWANFETELQSSGLSPFEIGRLRMAMSSVNALTEDRMIEARNRFLAARKAEQKQ